MSDEIYNKLAGVLDTLPNGFPSTDSGVEIKLLKKIFTPEDAEFFCDLRLKFETVEEIAKRTGRPIEGLKEKLIAMAERERFSVLILAGTGFSRCCPGSLGYMSSR